MSPFTLLALPTVFFSATAVASDVGVAPRTYIVSFTEPALLEVDPNALKAGAQAKAAQSAGAKASSKQNLHLDAAETAMKMALNPTARMIWTNNAVALTLSPQAAADLATQPGIASVEIEFTRTLQTDTGPAFIGAQALWAASAAQSGTRGAGVVVGIIDSGINTSHPSFAATASDGYQHSNPRGQRYGLCNTVAATRCSNKLIGLYDFTTEGNRDGTDLDGHGTHVASIAIGNPFAGQINAPTITLAVPISGVAPRANVIAYKACNKNGDKPTTCPGAALLAAIEQAAADRVSVVNYSIGGEARDPYTSLLSATDMRAMFNARAAGVVFSISAGNNGPAPSTVLSPANAPWVLAAANISHDRLLLNTLSGLTGSAAPPKIAFDGAGITASLATRAIVLAERFGSRLCSQGSNLDSPPSGVSNPFAPGTFNGEIVVCERGTQARIAKSFNLRAAGAGGMILINTALEGESVTADAHYLPTVHLGQADGALLRTWLLTTANARGSISGTASVRSPNLGDVLANSSSRGPVSAGILKPDIAAPGTDILAADLASGIRPLTGTSMAAPHIAGTLALIRALHPNWGVDEVESAVRTSALAGVVREAGIMQAPDFAQAGAGRVQSNIAEQARLYFPLTNPELLAGAANPDTLNLPSLVLAKCRTRCTFKRTVRASADMLGRGNWSAALIDAPLGLQLNMRPAQFSIAAGETQVLNFDVDVSNPLTVGGALNATLALRAAGFSSVRMPVSVISDPGAVPEELSFDAPSERGQINTELSGLVALPRPNAQLSEFSKVLSDLAPLAGDTTPDPFDTEGGGTAYRSIVINSVVGQFWASAASTTGRDVDLFLGRDGNNDGLASLTEMLCKMDSSASTESCRIDVKVAGTYWMVAQNTNPNASPDSVRLQYAAISAASTDTANPSNTRINTAVMPGNAAANLALPLTLGYDLGASFPGEEYVASLILRADLAALAPMSTTLIRLRRVAGPESPLILLDQRAENIAVLAGQTRSKIAFSVPFGATQVQLTGASTGALSAEIVRATANEASITGAPVGGALSSANFTAGPASLSLTGAALTPGRYYLRLHNSGASDVSVALQMRVTTAGAAPNLAPELYYNPARSGHGLILTRARNDAQFIWYTYDQSGQSAWYLFLPTGYYGTNPAVLTGPLLRSSWNGARGNGVQTAGYASITRTGLNEFEFGFNLLGLSGSEPMKFLGASGCIRGSNVTTPTDFTGMWYQPSTSGWGGSLHIAPGLEFVQFFIYDALGQPRWVLGTNNAPSIANVAPENHTLAQFTGFCPTCSYRPVSSQIVGNYALKMDPTPLLAADITAQMTLNATLVSPLAGSFIQSGDFALLTEKKSCLQ